MSFFGIAAKPGGPGRKLSPTRRNGSPAWQTQRSMAEIMRLEGVIDSILVAEDPLTPRSMAAAQSHNWPVPDGQPIHGPPGAAIRGPPLTGLPSTGPESVVYDANFSEGLGKPADAEYSIFGESANPPVSSTWQLHPSSARYPSQTSPTKLSSNGMQVPSQSPMSRGAQFPSQPAQFQSQGAQHSRSSRPAFLSQGVQPSKMSSLSQGDRMSAPASLLSQTVQMMQFPSQSARRASHGVQHSGPGAFSQGNQYSGPGAMSQGNQYSMPGVLSQGNQYSGPGAISQGNQFSMPVGAMSQGNQYSGPGAMSQGNQFSMPGAMSQGNQYSGPGAMSQGNQFSMPGAMSQANQYSGPGAMSKGNQFSMPGAMSQGNQFSMPGGMSQGNQYSGPGAMSQGNQFSMPGAMSQGNQYSGPGAMSQGNQFSMPGAMSQGNQYSGPGAMSQGNQFSMPGALSQGNQYSGPGALSETQQFPSQALDQESVGVQHSKNTTRFPSQAMQFPSQAAGQQSQGVPGDSSPLNFTSEGVQFPSQAPQVQSQGIQGSPAFDYSAQPSGILDGKSTLNAITSPRRNMNDLVNAWKQHAIEFEQALIDHKAQLNMIGSNLASTATRLNPPRVQAPEATGNSIAQPSATSLRQTESDGEEAGDADEEAATEPAVEEMDTHEDPPPPSDPESMHTDDVNVITGQDELQDTFVNVFNQMRDACELPKVRYDVFCKEQAQAAADTIATGNDANLEEGVLSHQGPTDDPTEAVETAVNAWFSDFGNMIVPSPDVTHVGVAIVDDYVVAYCMPVS